MKTAIQQLIEFINKMQNDGSGGLRVQAILDYAESLEQSHTSPMSAEQVELLESSKIALHTLDCIEFTREQGTASKRLETAISKLATTPSVKADGWVSVEDAIPVRGMKVRWRCSDGIEDIGFYYSERKVFANFDLRSVNEVTHWKPL